MTRFDAALLTGQEEPVRRYFTHAIAHGAPLTGVHFAMTGRIKAGVWLPFSADEKCDGRSFEWQARGCAGAPPPLGVCAGPLTLLRVVARFAGGEGATEGKLFGRLQTMRADGEDTTRSAAGRA